GTEKICRDFATSDARVRYVRNGRNLGAGPNFNLGFEISSGKYFKWCACDDKLSSNYLSECVSVLDINQESVLAYGATQSIDHDGHLIPLVGWMRPSLEEKSPALRFLEVVYNKGTCFEIFGVFRRDALQKSLLHRMYYGSDHALLAEMALLGTFVRVPDAVLYNREHPARSINMDTNERLSWQYTGAKSKRPLENINRLTHLIEIAIRHRRIASPAKTLSSLFLWALRPDQVARYLLDLTGTVSPSGRYWLRNTGWGLLQGLDIRHNTTNESCGFTGPGTLVRGHGPSKKS
ncbi:MAG TPA: glycosyltransferase, partial [Methylocella sp.]|nr:glycosyltransferase [Methylocella sp.]